MGLHRFLLPHQFVIIFHIRPKIQIENPPRIRTRCSATFTTTPCNTTYGGAPWPAGHIPCPREPLVAYAFHSTSYSKSETKLGKYFND